MRALRNFAIVAAIAVPVAFLPGGGQASRAIGAVLILAFLATIGVAGRQLYQQNRLTIYGLGERERAVLYGAVGLIVLMIAGAGKLLATGAGTLVWAVLLATAIFAIVRVWTDARSY